MNVYFAQNTTVQKQKLIRSWMEYKINAVAIKTILKNICII